MNGIYVGNGMKNKWSFFIYGYVGELVSYGDEKYYKNKNIHLFFFALFIRYNYLYQIDLMKIWLYELCISIYISLTIQFVSYIRELQ